MTITDDVEVQEFGAKRKTKMNQKDNNVSQQIDNKFQSKEVSTVQTNMDPPAQPVSRRDAAAL